ncbi:hypothetical protein [Blastococcus sp. CT_GayMR16]|uniref:hypothetical protein n=1 Tax=Blastococcus sp. CT_GayMR16 TaxID=2559607 RepID=UPI0010743CA7|nr:hypothetical protein [Blastococcus sp. CT_GayMR16]TFV88564.1 hypothetical protein E4P38_10360 [Blastococcus sp. CT_GayMR16]
MLWDIAEAIWEWATDNRRRAVRFFGTLGVVVVAAGVAVLVISTRPVAPEALCGTVADLEGELAVSFGSSTNNAVFDGLADVASESDRLDDEAPGAVADVHGSAPALEALADRDSIGYDEVMSALYPVQTYCGNLTIAAAQEGAAVQPQVAEPVPSADAGAPVTTSPSTTTSRSSSTSAAPTYSPEDQALLELSAARSDSLQGLVLDERWVAQVASKSVGIVDPLQTAQNGTHTFFAVDILAESEAARSSAGGAPVLVLQSTDFGKWSVADNGQPYWITVVDAGFASSDDVDAWCASTYPSLDPEALANACAARTLGPSHS